MRFTGAHAGDFLRGHTGAFDPLTRTTSLFPTPSGTGALRLAADFLFNFFGGEKTTVMYSKPTWRNHIDIFKRAGFTKLKSYSYWNADLKAADVKKFENDLKNAPDRSVIIFHACAHNPTGADPSQDDWKKLADVCEEKGHFPIFDTAYQVRKYF